MVDNALRCIESDYPELLGLARAMGVLNADGSAAPGIAWDYVGHKILESGEPLRDAQGNAYVHVNVRTPFSVGAAAAQAAQESPEIAAALVDPARFFVTDGQGNAIDPLVPMRVFL